MKNLTSLLIFFIITTSCSQDIPVTDYRFTPLLSVVSGEVFENTESGILEVYRNTPISLSLKINGAEIKDVDHKVKYIFTPGVGVVKTGGVSIDANSPITHKFKDGDLNLSFTPTTAGHCELSLIISNGTVSQTVPFKVYVREPSYIVTFNGLPDKKVLQKKFSFAMNIEEISQAAGETRSVQAYGRVTKGSGDIYISDQIIAENNKPNVVKIGSSIISYNAKELEENILTFELEDRYGSIQRFPVSFNIEKPKFNLSLNTDDNSLKVNNDYSFKVFIDNHEHPTNTFSLSYRFINGSGDLSLNGKNIKTGGQGNAITGDNILILNTIELGLIEMEIIVTDKFNTQNEVIFKNIATTNPLEVNLTVENLPIKMGSSYAFPVGLTAGNYSGKLYCSYRNSTGSNTISINGVSKKEGTKFEINPGSNNFRFTPDQPGEAEIQFVFSDETGREIIKTALFTVKANEIIVFHSEIIPGVVGGSVLFNITAKEDGYSSSFTAKYSLLSGEGVLKNGTAIINPNEALVLNNNVSKALSFIPNKVGINTIRLTISDTFGQSHEETLNIKGLPSAISFTAPGSILSSCYDESIFNVLFSELKYTGNFRMKFEMITGEGVLTNSAGIQISNSKELTLSASNAYALHFTPKKLGAAKFKLTLTDDHGQTSFREIHTNTTPYIVQVTPICKTRSIRGSARTRAIRPPNNTPVKLNPVITISLVFSKTLPIESPYLLKVIIPWGFITTKNSGFPPPYPGDYKFKKCRASHNS